MHVAISVAAVDRITAFIDSIQTNFTATELHKPSLVTPAAPQSKSSVERTAAVTHQTCSAAACSSSVRSLACASNSEARSFAEMEVSTACWPTRTYAQRR